MHAARFLSLALAAVTLTACSTAGAPSSAGLASRAPRVHRSGDVITLAEISRERASSAWDLVERLRPYYLRGRSAGFFDTGPLVYVDDFMLGDVNALRTVHANDVLEIRYVRGELMRTHIGAASGRQVIHVITKRD